MSEELLELVSKREVVEIIVSFKSGEQDSTTSSAAIVFENGEFSKALYPFTNNPYSRHQWKILAAIEQKISDIEEAIINQLKKE